MSQAHSDLLAADQLVKRYPAGQPGLLGGPTVHLTAVNQVSLSIKPGETLGLVGESGCGKSTLARLLGLLQHPDRGSIRFQNTDITHLPKRRLGRFRCAVQMVFQDPFEALNPRLPVSASILEPLVIHGRVRRGERTQRVAKLLQAVSLSPDLGSRYPHELSGGQRQRVAIARALALEPQLIIADEAVAALDVSVQSQILNLLVELKERLGLAYLFISHDLAVVDHLADRVAVMYLGRIVEQGSRESLFGQPAHPYTRALLTALPGLQRKLYGPELASKGDVPNPMSPPPGCPYHPRCPQAQARCRQELPILRPLDGDHRVACHFPLSA